MDNIFNFKYYISKYNDLHGITNEKDAWEHFFEYGINENRICKDYTNSIDPNFYMNNYPDLINAQIITHELALIHWYQHGIFECRKGLSILETTHEEFINNPFPKYVYDPTNLNSNLIDYLKRFSLNPGDYSNRHITDNLYNTIKKKNFLDIDLKLYKYVNKLEYNNLYDLLDHFYNDGLNGFIHCQKQIKNIYPTLQIYEHNNKLYCEDISTSLMELDKFVVENIYNKTYEELANLLIKKYEDNILHSINLCILLFIGNIERGNQIIDMLIEYKNLENFNLIICYNGHILYNELKARIINNFTNYRMYVSNEMGNDILPTLLMYDDLKKTYEPEHIIKLQTKSSYDIMSELTKHLLNRKLKDLLIEKTVLSNTIGNPKYYINIKDDFFNVDLYSKYSENIDMNKRFIGATIFYISRESLNPIVDFIKVPSNYRAFLLNNMYDSNRIVIRKSYVHFLERLFGTYRT